MKTRRWLLAVLALGLVATIGSMVPALVAKAADKDAAKAKAATGGEKEATNNESPEQWLQRIEKTYARSSGAASDQEYEKERTAFLEKNANSPLRWQLKLFDAQRAYVSGGNRTEGIKKAKAALAELSSAKDAPESVREQASILGIQIALQANPSKEELLKLATDHIANFPNSAVNASLGRVVVQSIIAGKSEEQAIASLQELKASKVAPLAAAANSQIAQLETMISLKKNPLELKFTAVDGKDINLEDYRGKIVLIDFWATWCGPCVAGLPEVLDLYKKYHDQGFEIVGISFDKDKDALEKFVKEKDMTWVQYFDGKVWQNDYGQKYGIHAIPTMWLVGRDGKVIDFTARADLANKVEKLVTADAPAQAASPAPEKP